MDARDFLILETKRLTEFFLRIFHQTDETRLEWAPDGGRSPLEQLREVAQATGWSAEILENQETKEWNLREIVRARRERDQWDLARCLGELETNSERLIEAIRAFPEASVEEAVEIPVHGRITFQQVMGLQIYHLAYHAGQIGYLQTLCGDKEMPDPGL